MTDLKISSIISRLGLAEEKLAETRLKICGKCEHYSHHQCAKCGCFMFIKARIKAMKCPIGLWGVFDKE
jgi:hypothetical protein